VCFFNVDPHTGYILLRDNINEKLHIFDPGSGEIILSVNGENYNPRLFNNRILAAPGHALDVSPFLP
jgi:hypothetical protein